MAGWTGSFWEHKPTNPSDPSNPTEFNRIVVANVAANDKPRPTCTSRLAGSENGYHGYLSSTFSLESPFPIPTTHRLFVLVQLSPFPPFRHPECRLGPGYCLGDSKVGEGWSGFPFSAESLRSSGGLSLLLGIKPSGDSPPPGANTRRLPSV